MLKRPCFICGTPTRASMCERCLASRPPQKRKPAVRASRQVRGYDAEYERNRAIMIQQARENDWPCYLCGRSFAPGQAITAEHKRSLRLGGTNDLENLAPACSRCNYGWRRRRR